MLLAIAGLGTPEILIVALVLFLFFGASKLPQAGQALGLGIKNFKKAMNGDEADVTPGKKKDKALASGSTEDEDEDEKATENAKG